ncbi:hypothetical protein JYU14_03700 [Simkania negevensis]|uniref:Uncharacterized protein n=1 Tax=Simkania negevensis TaxID=83561 RepID=A0ABS3AS17_9BACT|nr:hypothetical protein [Simkania negevensis]
MDRLDLTTSKASDLLRQHHQRGIDPSIGSKREEDNDPLLALAQKKNSDTIRLSFEMLRNKISRELDETISSYLSKHKEIEGNFFIAIVSGNDVGLKVEVVKKGDLLQSVTDFSAEEAKQLIDERHIGHFSPKDFSLQTPDDPLYQGLKKRISQFFSEYGPLLNVNKQ